MIKRKGLTLPDKCIHLRNQTSSLLCTMRNAIDKNRATTTRGSKPKNIHCFLREKTFSRTLMSCQEMPVSVLERRQLCGSWLSEQQKCQVLWNCFVWSMTLIIREASKLVLRRGRYARTIGNSIPSPQMGKGLRGGMRKDLTSPWPSPRAAKGTRRRLELSNSTLITCKNRFSNW